MDFLDYREKLGIGFCDTEKFKYFVQKINNALSTIIDDYTSGCVDLSEFYSFCNLTGTLFDNSLTPEHYNRERYRYCISVLNRHTESLNDYLSYYIAFTNSINTKKYSDKCWTRKDFATLLTNMCREAHIPIDLIIDNDEYFAFPKGVPQMDHALVSEPLEWLQDYPSAQTAWIKALKNYSETAEDNASDVADKFRKALEAFFQDFFKGNKSLENFKTDYGKYLKNQGIPKEISGNFETLLQTYTQFMNNYAKHRDATSDKLLEYIMYQTGNIIRLLITLRQEEQKDAS